LADFVVLGKIAEPYGVRGWIKIYPHADDPLDWASVPVWWVGREDRFGKIDWQQHKLVKCKAHGSTLVAQLEGIDDRSAAEIFKGQWVGSPREALPKLADNEFYWADLIGLNVVNHLGENLGVVAGLIGTGANDVLRVTGADEVERLLPYVDAVVRKVDVANGEIQVEWGLDW
jgi:16S rRNA processing protein RimM